MYFKGPLGCPLGAVACLLFALALPARPQVVISQIYGGGGNAGATLRNDFIELLNRGTAEVDIGSWSVQYASSTGSTWQSTNLSGKLQPGQYYLIQQSAGASGTENLPAPDAAGSINMSATAGKVVLLRTQTTIAPGVACPDAGVVDIAGYGTGTNCFKGAGPAPALSNTTAAVRADNGCADSSNNNRDFSARPPVPRNTASPVVVCSGGLSIVTESRLPNATVNAPYAVQLRAEGGTGTVLFGLADRSNPLPAFLALSTSGYLSGTPATSGGSPFTFTVRARDDSLAFVDKTFEVHVDGPVVCAPTHTISQVQGSGPVSPLASNTVVTVSGIVTGLRSNGFFVQSAPEDDDGNPETSEGLFVFTSGAPAVARGTLACITGPVVEFAPSSDPLSPSLTEISLPASVFSLTTDNPLPGPVVLTAAGTDPAGGLDVLERYEGMRVEIASLRVIGPTGGTVNEANASSTSNGIFYGVMEGMARPFREPGIEAPNPAPSGSIPPIPRFDANPERIAVDSRGQVGAAGIDVAAGQLVSGLVGPLDYRSRRYTLTPDAEPAATISGTITARPVPAPEANEVTVATFNMERFYDTANNPDTSDAVLTEAALRRRMSKASLAIRDVLRAPDILAVVEMENLDTLKALAAKINEDAAAAGQPKPNYEAYLIEGNDPGGINTGFLVKTPRVNVVEVMQAGKRDTYLDPVSNQPATLHDRPPLLLRAAVTGTSLTVIANHLRSLNGIDDAADGARVRAKRRAQAEAIAKLVQARQQADPAERIMVVGDFNAYEFSDGFVDVMGIVRGDPAPLPYVVLGSADLVNPDLVNLTSKLPPEERYSYVFNGNAQALDHILVNTALEPRITRMAYARMNADFPEFLRNDAARPERLSDHDAAVAYLTVQAAVEVTAQISAVRSGLTYDRTALLYNGTVTLTNDGPAIAGPVVMMLSDLTPGVTLANASGTNAGSPYIVTAGGGLDAGQSREVAVSFHNTPNGPVNYVLKVYSGHF